MPAFLILGMVLVTTIVLLSMLTRAARRSNPHAARRYDTSGDSPMMFVDGGSSADCGAGDGGCGDGGGGGGGD